MNSLGLVTVGQAPRTDVTPDVVARLPDDVDVEEAGALDPFDSPAAVADGVGPKGSDPVFVTRLRDGSEVTVDRAAVGDLLRDRVAEVAAGVDAVGVLCTGALPSFDAPVPVLEPSALLRAWADAVADDGPVGMLVPKPEQVPQVEAKWAGRELVAAAASPYEEDDRVADAAAEVADADPEVVVMDCIGYTPAMKRTVRETTGTGVLLGRSVLAKTLTELV